MKPLLIILFLFCLSNFSCNKKSNESYYLKAKVIITSDVSCSLPVLDFSEDSIAIRNLTKHNDITYTVLQLPENFNIKNKNLYVSVKVLMPAEEFPCNTLGIFYPHLKILQVKDR